MTAKSRRTKAIIEQTDVLLQKRDQAASEQERQAICWEIAWLNRNIAYALSNREYRRRYPQSKFKESLLDDCKQEALLGLWIAAWKYPIDCNVSFCTYSGTVVKRSIDECFAKDQTVWIPRRSRQNEPTRKRYQKEMAQAQSTIGIEAAAHIPDLHPPVLDGIIRQEQIDLAVAAFWSLPESFRKLAGSACGYQYPRATQRELSRQVGLSPSSVEIQQKWIFSFLRERLQSIDPALNRE